MIGLRRTAPVLGLLLLGTACGDNDGGLGDASGTDSSDCGAACETFTQGGSESGTADAGEDTGESDDGSETDDETGNETETSDTGEGELPGELVVDVDWLEQYLDDPRVQVIDTRASATEHIPGAIPLRPLDLTTTVDGVGSQSMPQDEAELVLQDAGLRNGTTAVIYGASPEFDAPRVTWALHYYQHHDVRYLDGGWEAWVDGGHAVDDGAPLAEPSEYEVAGTDDSVRVTGEWVLGQLGDPPYDVVDLQIVDARSDGEYTMGRIPSATHIEWTDNLDASYLRPVEELDPIYTDFDRADATVSYCLAGWRASAAWLTLRHLGFEDARVYDGSWLEWGDGNFPVETD